LQHLLAASFTILASAIISLTSGQGPTSVSAGHDFKHNFDEEVMHIEGRNKLFISDYLSTEPIPFQTRSSAMACQAPLSRPS
jgi:hypothetical protein